VKSTHKPFHIIIKTNGIRMKTALIIFFICFKTLSVFAQSSKQIIPKNQDYGIMYAYNDSLQYETYPQTVGWGYRIYHRYQLLVNQSIIPAVAGNKSFKNEKDAKKIAQLATSKVAKGQMPPTINPEEIGKLIK
jgi:hypothetical protein